MTSALKKRRPLIVAGVLAFVALTAAGVYRLTLAGVALGTLLRKAGASEITFNVSRVSPWRVVVDDIGFQIETQPFAAKRVTIARKHWWTPSLGAVRVEQARLPVRIAGSDANPSVQSSVENSQTASQPISIPAEEISIDGQLVVQVAALPEQALTVKFEARQADPGKWTAQVQVDGPGLGLKAEGTYDLPRQDLAFKVPELSLDLKQWQQVLQQVSPLPGGAATIEGKITGNAEGRLVGKALTAGGTVRLREGRYQNDQSSVVAEGVEADVSFIDLTQFLTAPSALRARELRTGQITMSALEAEVAFEGMEKVTVSRASLKALGGSVSVEPFKYALNLHELEVVLLVDGINVEDVMALTKDLPAKAKGRVSGRIPVRIDENGMRFGSGWLALTPGAYAEIQFNAAGLLTSGVSPDNPSYAMLKKVESGLLKLKINELRLDIRPPTAPAGRSAQLHVQGEPVDPNLKAPVMLDLNVNGPLEQLLNMGMDSRLSFGSGK
jgi:hypothetical protein